jgi:TRAP-type C4-dicarboxylate transport system substrate-binding protein
MEKGTIDGTTGAWEQLKGSRFGEVGEYLCPLNIYSGCFAAPNLMNWDTWNSLPPDIQKVFEDNADAWRNEVASAMLQADQEGLDFALGLGDTLYELPPEEIDKFYDLLDAVYLEEMAKIDAKGYPGTEIYKEIRQRVQEYSK